MNSTHIHLSRRASIRILLFLTLVLAIPVGLRSGYAHEAVLRLTPSAHTALYDSQSLPPGQTTTTLMGKPIVPSICSPIGFSNNTYAVGNGSQEVDVSDFNGDGIPDLATANYYGNNASVLLGNGNGT